MHDADGFAKRITAVAELYGKAISEAVLEIWWSALADYTDEEVAAALSAHVRSPERGRFMPTPADVVEQLQGSSPRPAEIIAAARNPQTPLAVLCRMQIGSWALDHMQNRELESMAYECIGLMPEWRALLRSGGLKQHAVDIMAKHGVDPAGGQTLFPRQGVALAPKIRQTLRSALTRLTK